MFENQKNGENLEERHFNINIHIRDRLDTEFTAC